MTAAFLRSAVVGFMMIGCGGAPSVSSSGGGSNGNSPGLGGSGNPGAGGSGNIGLPDNQTPPVSSGTGGTTGTTPTGDNNCGVTRIPLQKQPADLLLVLDRSRSMIQDVNGRGGGNNNNNSDAGVPAGPSKWSEVVAAIDPVIKSTQAEVAWGLKLYPLTESCGVPDGASTTVATGNYDAIMTAIKANDPANGGGSTPTRLAVEKATAFMKSTPSTNSKYLVIATDGQPNCAGGRGNGDDVAGAVASVAAAAAAGIPSFVVGVATANGEANDTLNQMAEKGGRARMGATKYFPVASRDELVSVLETITGQIASCTFPLTPTPPVPENVAVEIDGQRVAHDTTQMNGWNYGPQNKSLILYGAICDSLKAGTAKNVQILYGCPGVTIN